MNVFIDWLLQPPDFRSHAYKSSVKLPTDMSEFIAELVIPFDSRVFRDRLLDSGPREFQDLVADFFRQLGGQVINGNTGADGAIDALWKTPRGDYIIQCKKRRQKVGEPVVREIFGAAAKNVAHGAFIVTTSEFINNAVQFADGVKPQIGLINGKELFNLVTLAMPAVARKFGTGSHRWSGVLGKARRNMVSVPLPGSCGKQDRTPDRQRHKRMGTLSRNGLASVVAHSGQLIQGDVRKWQGTIGQSSPIPKETESPGG
jgi:hypothetical protein